jgi:nicotinamide mononucleotide transporter
MAGSEAMSTLYWLTSMASLAAVWLNICRRVECFIIWTVTNAVWAVADWTHGLQAQAALQAVYLALSLYGIRKWSQKRGGAHE